MAAWRLGSRGGVSSGATFLECVCRALDDAGVEYALVGGHAVALHGAVRGTVDVDVVLRWERQVVAAAEGALRKLGLVSQLPISAEDVVDHRHRLVHERNLIGWHFYNPRAPMEQVNIVIAYDLAGKQVARIPVANGSVPVLAVPALIAMKRASGRPQDIEDATALEKLL